MIELKSGVKSYGDLTVLNNVDLKLEKGKFYIIHGPSGSGKTTLLNIIAGFENLDKGAITLNGESYPRAFRDKLMFRNVVSVVFQDFLLIPEKTVKANLLIALEYSDLNETEKDKIIVNELEKLELDSKINVEVSHLSGGQQQRISLLRALLKKHKILILDEPTGNLDDDATEQIMQLISKSRSDDKVIVMVTHDRRLHSYADELINIENLTS